MKKVLIVSFATLFAIGVTTGAILTSSGSSLLKIKGTGETYTLLLDSNHNKINSDGDGSYIVSSNTDGEFLFNYECLNSVDNYYCELTDIGIIYNDITSPLTGLLSISIDTDNEVVLSYGRSYSGHFIDFEVESLDSVNSSFDFGNYYPAYIRIESAGSDCLIRSISLTYDCTSNSGNVSYETVSGVTYELYNGDANLVKCSSGVTGDLTINREDLMNIDYDAFDGCSLDTLSILGSGGFSISPQAFQNASIDEIYIEKSITTIYESSFLGLEINKLTLPISIDTIDAFAFDGYELSEIYYLGTMEQWDDLNKDSMWRGSTVIDIIHCSDGDINL